MKIIITAVFVLILMLPRVEEKYAYAEVTLEYSTFLSGYGNDEGTAVAVDEEGCAYSIGSTSSSDFPTINEQCGRRLQPCFCKPNSMKRPQ